MKNRLITATLIFAKLALIWLVALILLRVFEVLLNGFGHEFPDELPRFLFWAAVADIVFWFQWLFWQYLVFLLLSLLSPRLARGVYAAFIVIITIIQLSLVQYFYTSLVPLGADFYGYSITDIKQTVGASGSLNIQLILSFLLFLGLLIAALRFFPPKINIPFGAAIAFPVISFLFLMSGVLNHISGKPFKSDFVNNMLLNKAAYFFGSSYAHFYQDDEDIYADAYIGDFEGREVSPSAFRLIGGTKFPFYREVDSTDVLSPFFNIPESRPNIVIVLVEGLGRAFTNDGAYLGNFTPFLDSLSKKSLYWKNFLSEGGRTFAVLPSLMGSLPFSKNGYLELGDQMPAHLSLFNLLKYSGYQTSFYYGGDASFDNMSLFLKQNNVDEINDINSFPKGFTKLPAANGFTWGYGDTALFRHYFASRRYQTAPPQLNVLLTVATHNPFLINDQQKYLKRFEERLNALGLDNAEKDTYRNYKLQYSSILYTDDAVQQFFDNYKKRKDFANTIFLITGDHRMPEIPMRNKIDRYHVPLIIYSPLLKRTAQFASISTHFDIAPSLLAFLHHNFALKVPSQASWLGEGLDTARAFRNIHKYPLMQTKQIS